MKRTPATGGEWGLASTHLIVSAGALRSKDSSPEAPYVSGLGRTNCQQLREPPVSIDRDDGPSKVVSVGLDGPS